MSEIVKKLKRPILLTRIWFWAAVRSPHFCDCQLAFDSPLIKVQVSRMNPRYEFLRIQISFNRPRLILDISWDTCLAFIKARAKAGEIIKENDIDDIPF